MEYFKKNKVFIFLVGILAVSIIALGLQLMNNNDSSSAYQPNQTEKGSTSINSFNVELNSSLDLTFSWNIKRGSEVIEKVEIYHGDTLLQDVTDKAIYSLSLFHSGIHTGNNEFTFKVYLDTGTVLQKSQYHYIDEVQDFNMSKDIVDNKIRYTVTYYDDKERKAGTLMVNLSHNRTGDIPIKFVSTNVLSEEGGYEKVQVIYEIDINALTEAPYQVNYTFSFDDYNLTINRSDTIEL